MIFKVKKRYRNLVGSVRAKKPWSKGRQADTSFLETLQHKCVCVCVSMCQCMCEIATNLMSSTRGDPLKLKAWNVAWRAANWFSQLCRQTAMMMLSVSVCVYVRLCVCPSLCVSLYMWLCRPVSFRRQLFKNTNNICFAQQVHLLFYTHTHTHIGVHAHTGTATCTAWYAYVGGLLLYERLETLLPLVQHLLCVVFVSCLPGSFLVVSLSFSLSPFLSLSISFLLLCQDKNSFFIWYSSCSCCWKKAKKNNSAQANNILRIYFVMCVRSVCCMCVVCV